MPSSDCESNYDSSEAENNDVDDSSSVQETFTIPRVTKGDQLQRLILIDGFNIMHHFKNMGFQNGATSDEKMCPLILIPLIMDFVQNGYVVRVVMKNIPDVKKTSDLYIIDFLQENGMLLYPREDDTEKDDLLLLYLAKKYHALIVTNDQFRNHKEYDKTADEHCISYDKIPTGYFKSHQKSSSEVLKDYMVFKYNIALHDIAGKFIVDPRDEDYEEVAASKKKFKQLKHGNILNFQLLNMYIYSSWCYIYNYGVPDCVKTFITPDSFPLDFDHFKIAYLEYLEEKEKKTYHGGRYTEVPRDDVSDIDLNAELND